MRTTVTLLLCLLFISVCSHKAETTYTVNVDIQFNSPDAEEVYIVWGINGWGKADKIYQPEGTFEKMGLLATPMKDKDGLFHVSFKTPPNTMLDYVFWITKGPHGVPCDIWDVNVSPQKDYHTLAVNDNLVVINGKMPVRPAQPLTILEYAPVLFLFAVLLLAAFIIIKRTVYKSAKIVFTTQKLIIAGSFLLLLCSLCARASVAKLSWDIYYEPARHAGKLLWAGYYDYLYVLGLFIFFSALYYLSRKFKYGDKIVLSLFVIVGIVSLLASLLNIRIVNLLGKPFNYRWFYYSGFLNTTDSKAALSSNISGAYVLQLGVVCVSAILLAGVLIYLYDLFLIKIRYKRLALFLVLALNAGFIMKARASLHDGLPGYERLSNPVAAFIESINPFTPEPELFTMEVEDSLQFHLKSNSPRVLSLNKGKIKNVLLIVLESTPANVIAPYDKSYHVTPVIESLLPNALVFENVYAHAPATNKTMFSVLCSAYPWLSYNSETQEFPAINLQALPAVLKNKGYRTGFFNSGDNRFQDAGTFLSAHGFEAIKDLNSVKCNTRFDEKQREFEPLDGLDDACTADELISWTRQNDARPFFGMLWTYQTHYPYFGGQSVKKFVDYDTTFNKYLNVVNHSDQVIGKIVQSLKESNMYDSTLIVIMGDHGEAFGTHDQITHASKIYEENVHIPCLFVNTSFKGAALKGIGGVVDVAPTILDLLGMRPHVAWQGASLLNNTYDDRAYFFCPWSDYLFGFREGKMKYIYNATKNTSELYDLENDPLEKQNIAGNDANIEIYQQKLAAWVQYQDRFMKKITGL